MNEENMIKDITNSVLKTIHSEKTMYQFILEELDAAQHGNEEAKNFVKNSGFKLNEYNGAMGRSFDEVDGVGGPQQTLLMFIMSLNCSMEEKASIRIKVVKNIISEFKNAF